MRCSFCYMLLCGRHVGGPSAERAHRGSGSLRSLGLLLGLLQFSLGTLSALLLRGLRKREPRRLQVLLNRSELPPQLRALGVRLLRLRVQPP